MGMVEERGAIDRTNRECNPPSQPPQTPRNPSPTPQLPDSPTPHLPQDLLTASLFRNFLLAERIMSAAGCTPVSYPRLPPTHQHPMWQVG